MRRTMQLFLSWIIFNLIFYKKKISWNVLTLKAFWTILNLAWSSDSLAEIESEINKDKKTAPIEIWTAMEMIRMEKIEETLIDR